jgi:hypothetical protein
MNYLQLFKESIRTVQKNKIVWGLSFFAILTASQPTAGSIQTTILWLCFLPIGLVIYAVSFIANAGIIYIVDQAENGRLVSLPEAWEQGKTSIIQVLNVSFLIFIPVFLVEFGFYIYAAIKWSTSIWPLIIMFLFEAFVNSIFYFAVCAIVIGNAKTIPALKTSLTLCVKHIGTILILNGLFAGLRHILLGIAFFIRLIITSNNSLPLEFSVGTYQKLLGGPTAFWTNLIFFLLIWPLWLTVLMKVYKIFITRERERHS